jgi:menaquinone-dependent protoporphyrinogen oxidase
MAVLVAYATDYGSTRGVADRIAGRLQLRGVGAEVCAVTDVLEASRYEAVVLGSAIHGGKWLPAARQFADRNAAPMRERPVWLFSVSTLGDEESMFPPRLANRLRAFRKETPELAEMRQLLHPREHRNSPARSRVRTGQLPGARSSGPPAAVTARARSTRIGTLTCCSLAVSCMENESQPPAAML